nr:site-specific DNA-methyltransferase [Canibacter zhuwentaonis]
MIIHGDNLEALKALLPRYEGRIDCIYIDPPYNTGNEGWVYSDAVNDPRIKKWLGQVVGKESEDLSRHDKWLCMMYPRLRLLQRLLAPTGVIFISIDDNEAANLKLICDEVFGATCFVADIAVVNNLSGRSDAKYIATAHEHLMMYRGPEFVSNGVAMPDKDRETYKLRDELGGYRLLGLRKTGSNSRREDRPGLFYSFSYNVVSGELKVDPASTGVDEITILPRLSDGSDGRWRWGRETAQERINELEVKLVKGRNEYDVYQKDYVTRNGEGKRVKPKSVWQGSEFSSGAGTREFQKIMGKGMFETPKPSALIEYCLSQVSKPDCLVLDSFAGSGTTAHAVLKANATDGQNRSFILVELGDYADTVTAERVRRVIKGFKGTHKGDNMSVSEITGGGGVLVL